LRSALKKEEESSSRIKVTISGAAEDIITIEIREELPPCVITLLATLVLSYLKACREKKIVELLDVAAIANKGCQNKGQNEQKYNSAPFTL